MPNRTCTIGGCRNTHRARGLCATHYNRLRYTATQRHPKVETGCVVCGTVVVRRKDNPYQPTCSVPCRAVVQWGLALAAPNPYDWRVDVASRARRAGCLIVESFDREEIFERDNWLCYLCGVRCNEPNPYDTQAATIDHVVPFALNGEHSRANVRTACLSCNAAKRDQLAAA